MHNLKYEKIRVGRKYIEAICMKLQGKNFILLRGSRGYCMCGYLDLAVAEKFSDTAVRITGVLSIAQAIRTTVSGCTTGAKKLGIYEGQPIKEVLRIIV